MWHFHKWKVIKLYKYTDISFGGQSSKTKRIYKCSVCGKIKEDGFDDILHGHNWELEDFK
jgi:hypothetical protein